MRHKIMKQENLSRSKGHWGPTVLRLPVEPNLPGGLTVQTSPKMRSVGEYLSYTNIIYFRKNTKR